MSRRRRSKMSSSRSRKRPLPSRRMSPSRHLSRRRRLFPKNSRFWMMRKPAAWHRGCRATANRACRQTKRATRAS